MLSPKPWRAEATLRFFLGVFVCMSLGILLLEGVNPMVGGPESEGGRLLQFLVNFGSIHGASLVLIHFFLKEHGMSWTHAFGFKSGKPFRCLFLGLCAGLISFPMVIGLGQFSALCMTLIGVEPQSQQTVEVLKSTLSVTHQIVFGIMIIFVAPLAEEIIFRGILYPLMKKNGHRYTALWGSSLLFGLIHSNVMTFVPLTLFSVFLTLLYEKTDNLTTPMVTHGVFNALNFSFLIWQQ